jgi:hypothetical protein
MQRLVVFLYIVNDNLYTSNIFLGTLFSNTLNPSSMEDFPYIYSNLLAIKDKLIVPQKQLGHIYDCCVKSSILSRPS